MNLAQEMFELANSTRSTAAEKEALAAEKRANIYKKKLSTHRSSILSVIKCAAEEGAFELLVSSRRLDNSARYTYIRDDLNSRLLSDLSEKLGHDGFHTFLEDVIIHIAGIPCSDAVKTLKLSWGEEMMYG